MFASSKCSSLVCCASLGVAATLTATFTGVATAAPEDAVEAASFAARAQLAMNFDPVPEPVFDPTFVLQDTQPEPVGEMVLDRPMIGGQGTITTQGMRGMFINPTSGTLNKGQATLQYCVLFLENDGDNNIGHGLMFAYGLTDKWEIGVFGTYIDADVIGEDFFAGGPFAKYRIIEEDADTWVPEVAVGGIGIAGDSEATRYEVFVAASKGFELQPDGFFRELRPHVGFRQVWRDVGGDDSVLYGGLELKVPYDISLIGEISTENGNEDTPWALGAQWRPTGVMAFSLAIQNVTDNNNLSTYIGIGVNF